MKRLFLFIGDMQFYVTITGRSNVFPPNGGIHPSFSAGLTRRIILMCANQSYSILWDKDEITTQLRVAHGSGFVLYLQYSSTGNGFSKQKN